MIRAQRGFTLIELLTVMALIALLLTISLPRYFSSVTKAKEAVLKQDLRVMRDAIDKYFADNGTYPSTLDDLVSRRYLRSIPTDPTAIGAEAWRVVPPGEQDKGGVFDVHSSSDGKALDGTLYEQW